MIKIKGAKNPSKKSIEIVKTITNWPDWYYTDVSSKELVKEIRNKFKINNKLTKEIFEIWSDYKDGRLSKMEFEDYVNYVLQNKGYTGP